MSNEIKTDGLYKSPPNIDTDGEKYWRYLRFRIDGSVTMVLSTGTEADVAQWLERRNNSLANGLYSLEGEKIEFRVKADGELLKTRFAGTIKENEMCVRMWNSNSDFDATEVYAFKPVKIDHPSDLIEHTPNHLFTMENDRLPERGGI